MVETYQCQFPALDGCARVIGRISLFTGNEHRSIQWRWTLGWQLTLKWWRKRKAFSVVASSVDGFKIKFVLKRKTLPLTEITQDVSVAQNLQDLTQSQLGSFPLLLLTKYYLIILFFHCLTLIITPYLFLHSLQNMIDKIRPQQFDRSKDGHLWLVQTFQRQDYLGVTTLHLHMSRPLGLFALLFRLPHDMKERWEWNTAKSIWRAFNSWYKSLWERQSAIIENKIWKLSVDLTLQFYGFAWVWIMEASWYLLFLAEVILS